jgi:hemerythrin superfamily protein
MTERLQILSLMKEDHHEIESLIDSLQEALDGSYDEMRKKFEQFEWRVEKHLFVEEKAIFTFYEPDDVVQGFQMLPTITKHHNFILNELKKMRKEVNNGKEPEDLTELKKFLIKHRNYEEVDVYPKLEEALKPDQKEKIINRINEIR